MVFAIGCGYNSKGSGMMAASAPSIVQLMPTSVVASGPAFTLLVNGSNFAAGATVYWNGSPRNTMFLSASKVAATISAADIATASTVVVYVRNPGGSGIYMNQPGQNSNTINFTVNP
jgi:hypothetical protein